MLVTSYVLFTNAIAKIINENQLEEKRNTNAEEKRNTNAIAKIINENQLEKKRNTNAIAKTIDKKQFEKAICEENETWFIGNIEQSIKEDILLSEPSNDAVSQIVENNKLDKNKCDERMNASVQQAEADLLNTHVAGNNYIVNTSATVTHSATREKERVDAEMASDCPELQPLYLSNLKLAHEQGRVNEMQIEFLNSFSSMLISPPTGMSYPSLATSFYHYLELSTSATAYNILRKIIGGPCERTLRNHQLPILNDMGITSLNFEQGKNYFDQVSMLA